MLLGEREQAEQPVQVYDLRAISTDFVGFALRCSPACLYLSFIVIYVRTDKIVWHSVFFFGIWYIFYRHIALSIALVFNISDLPTRFQYRIRLIQFRFASSRRDE